MHRHYAALHSGFCYATHGLKMQKTNPCVPLRPLRLKNYRKERKERKGTIYLRFHKNQFRRPCLCSGRCTV